MPDTATTQIVTGVDFVSIPTTDLERSRVFYRDVLGLRETVVRDPHNVEYETGSVTLCVLDPVKMGLGEFSANEHLIALQTADVDAARAELEARGITFSADTLDTGVCHMGFFEDPDGNKLMLHHRYAPKES